MQNRDHLLGYMKLHTRAGSLLVLSAPDRDRLYGPETPDPPRNLHQVYGWNSWELAIYLNNRGRPVLDRRLLLAIKGPRASHRPEDSNDHRVEAGITQDAALGAQPLLGLAPAMTDHQRGMPPRRALKEEVGRALDAAAPGPAIVPMDAGLPAARLDALLRALDPHEVEDKGGVTTLSSSRNGLYEDTAVIICTSGSTGGPLGRPRVRLGRLSRAQWNL